jgi:sulfate adenylyltransferase subunit 1 (EFTu-like GTPase family)
MRVVGASIRVAYTGSVDEEKGFLVGSHVYDKRVCELSDKKMDTTSLVQDLPRDFD